MKEIGKYFNLHVSTIGGIIKNRESDSLLEACLRILDD